MEKLTTNTPTELLKLVNNAKNRHNDLKSEIFVLLGSIEEAEKTINDKLKKLDDIEKEYVRLMEKLTKIK